MVQDAFCVLPHCGLSVSLLGSVAASVSVMADLGHQPDSIWNRLF